MKCKICDTDMANPPVRCRELMFGLREEFDYLKCSVCGCLQIAKIPADMAAYYPGDYYSFAKPANFESANPRGVRLLMRRALSNLRLCSIAPLRNAARRTSRGPVLPAWLEVLPKPVFTGSQVLDVGCGAGRDLLYLQHCGYRNLAGVDPYIQKTIDYPGITISKIPLEKVEGNYDLVMLHHVFEHMADPLGILTQLARVVKPSGQVLIRIPLVDSFAAAKYGTKWVQLDVPRHFFLHTRASMEIAARRTGFKITRVVYDSTEMQFWGSEQYLKEIPLFAPSSYGVAPVDSIFSSAQIRQFAEKARELNRKEQGDQACFVLQRDLNGKV